MGAGRTDEVAVEFKCLTATYPDLTVTKFKETKVSSPARMTCSMALRVAPRSDPSSFACIKRARISSRHIASMSAYRANW